LRCAGLSRRFAGLDKACVFDHTFFEKVCAQAFFEKACGQAIF
jgi:hypothetical protein